MKGKCPGKRGGDGETGEVSTMCPFMHSCQRFILCYVTLCEAICNPCLAKYEDEPYSGEDVKLAEISKALNIKV